MFCAPSWVTSPNGFYRIAILWRNAPPPPYMTGASIHDIPLQIVKPKVIKFEKRYLRTVQKHDNLDGVYVHLKEKFGLFVDFEYLTEWALGAPTNRFPLVWEKKPPMGSGWKRRSKILWSTGISRGNDRDVMSAFDFVPIFTPFIYVHFCIWLGHFVDRWWLKEVWYAPAFFVKPLYSSDPHPERKRNRRLEWTIFPWHASQKTR